MIKYKVSDMNKDYIINFLQEYSYYIKQYRQSIKRQKEFNLMCPTEFFNNTYLEILKEIEETDKAFTLEKD